MLLAALLLSAGLDSARAAQSQVLLNRGFEKGDYPWVVGYWGGSSVTTAATPEAPSHSGNYTRHLYGVCSPGFFNATAQGLGSGNGTIGIPAGAVFHASAWFRCPDAATTPCEVRVRPRCSATGVGASIIYTLTDNDWHFVGDDGTGTGITMPASDWLDLRLYGPSGRDVYVDDAKILVDFPAITGTVALSDAADPTGTTITLKDASDVVLGSTVIDNAGGTYSIPIAAGTYSVTASKTGYFPNSATGIVMASSDVAVPTITLTAKASYTITASAGDNGSISPSGSVTVYQGDSQTFTFVPAFGYLADQVTIDGVPETANPAGYTFSDINAGHTIHISFKVDPFIRFKFDSTLQGWINLGGGTNTFISRTGGDMGAGQSAPNFVGIDNWDNRDGCTSTLWVRSPSFTLDTTVGDLTFYMAGGSGAGVGALPAKDSLVPTGPTGASGSGFMGLALRDDVTGDYVLKASRAGAGGDWQQFTFTAAAMDAVIVPGRAYTLDFIDTYVNGWGWISLDTVSIPGALVPVTYTSVSGTVTESGMGVAGAVVTASYPGGSVSSPATGADGSYTITDVPVGKLITLTVSAGAKLPTYIPDPFTAPDTNPVNGKDITVAGTYHISGTVTNGGSPVVGLTVKAVGTTTYTGTTLGDGTYSIVVVNDTYTVSVPVGLFSASPQSGITVSNADATGVNFVLTSSPALVDVSAGSADVGTTVTALTNTGTLGGVFTPGGPGSPSTAPLSTVVAGNRALYFDGSVGMGLVSAADPNVAIDAPATIVGNYPNPRPVFTLVAWVWRSELDGSMGVFSWAPFFYGANFQYGNGWAADHFGAGNLGWSALPAAGSWHQLVYTSDGATEKVYSDGVVAGNASAPTAFLNVDDYTNLNAQAKWKGVNNPIALGQIENNDAWNWFDTRNFKGAISAVRLYDFAVTSTDVAALYSSYKPDAGTGYNVTGYIYGPDGVTGIDGAQVSAKIGTSVVAGPVTTSGGGAYTLPLGPGTYNIVASATGYRSGSLTGIVVSGADVPDQNITLQAIPADRLAISIDASEATSAGVVNHGYYGGSFVPAQGTPTVGLAGPTGDKRPGVSFAYQRWQLQKDSAWVLSSSDVSGNAPFTVVAWVYQNSANVNQNQGQRNMYFTWAPLGASGAAGCGLGWRTWGGAYPGFDSGNTPVVCWDGYSDDFATTLATGKMPWDAWIQIVTMYDGTSLHFYRNGVEVVGGANSSVMPRAYNLQTAIGNPFSLGGFSNGWGDGQYWGSIARLKMYSKTLTQAEIDEDLANPPGAMSSYASWAALHAGGQTPDLDYNNDGVSNGIAYFMGVDGQATNPGVVNGTVTWPWVNPVTSYQVQVSDDLQTWEAATGVVAPASPPGNVVYTLPAGAAKKFCRLMVTP